MIYSPDNCIFSQRHLKPWGNCKQESQDLTQVYNKNISFYNSICDIPQDILRRLEFVSF